MNCWEFKKCGREPGGLNTDIHGVCEAAVLKKFNGVHGGRNAGRACWVVAGSYGCGNRRQGSYARHVTCCLDCDFYRQVRMEEMPKGTFHMTPILMFIGLNEPEAHDSSPIDDAGQQLI